ncbi:hypothetical protein E2C01_010332 [Portunus trituberculatus]|uniref:Uncharacterized protein n=1 Tax=Portunus trituberculatus TaxID=210409 RepID=A0A5B7D866_PORTR|nr:hypothetical protein [Portunus trituberculatus]
MQILEEECYPTFKPSSSLRRPPPTPNRLVDGRIEELLALILGDPMNISFLTQSNIKPYSYGHKYPSVS